MDRFLYQIEKSTSPLHKAASQNNINDVKLKLSAGAKVNTMTRHHHVSPLHCAAKYGHLEATQLLVHAGANLECKTSDGYTALDLAIERCRPRVSKLLIEKGANVNGFNKIYGTHLHFACSYAHLGELAKLLIHHGANIDARDSKGATPLHEAVKVNEKIVELLISHGADINPIDKNRRTPLHLAISSADIDIIKLLIRKGAALEIKDVCNHSPLMLATQFGLVEIVETLLESGANVDYSNGENETPLHIAANKGFQRIAELLINNGAGLEAKTYRSRSTPLHYAVSSRRQKIVKLLLAKGANVNAKTTAGFTPLFLAAESDNIELLKILLDRGAYHDSKLDEFETTSPVNVAHFANKLEIAAVLESTIRMFNSVIIGDIEEVERYIVDKCIVNARESIRGNTALHYVTSVRVFKFLIKNGASYNMKNKKGESPLDIIDNEEILCLLQFIEKMYECAKSGDKSIIEKLRNLENDDLEAILRVRNNKNHTLIQVATMNKHEDIAGELSRMLKEQHSSL